MEGEHLTPGERSVNLSTRVHNHHKCSDEAEALTNPVSDVFLAMEFSRSVPVHYFCYARVPIISAWWCIYF